MRAARAGRRIVMRPTEHGFVGPLAGELEEYIRFKASMGRHGATRVRVLRSFDRHCLEHGAVRLERGVVERWIAHRIDANPGGCRSWFSYIRDFGRWMRLAHDPDAYVLSDQWKAGSPRPTPYLLTDREAALFLRAAGTLESPSPWAWQSRAFFMLMACCGLRTREVRRLAVGHVDHKARSIDVVDSKAGRSRRLPVGDEVAAELLECDQRSRERFGDDRPAFFVTSTGVLGVVPFSWTVIRGGDGHGEVHEGTAATRGRVVCEIRGLRGGCDPRAGVSQPGGVAHVAPGLARRTGDGRVLAAW